MPRPRRVLSTSRESGSDVVALRQDRCGVCLTINLQRCITSYRGCHVNARRARGPVCTASVPVLDRAPICQRVSGPARCGASVLIRVSVLT